MTFYPRGPEPDEDGDPFRNIGDPPHVGGDHAAQCRGCEGCDEAEEAWLRERAREADIGANLPAGFVDRLDTEGGT